MIPYLEDSMDLVSEIDVTSGRTQKQRTPQRRVSDTIGLPTVVQDQYHVLLVIVRCTAAAGCGGYG